MTLRFTRFVVENAAVAQCAPSPSFPMLCRRSYCRAACAAIAKSRRK